MIYTINCAIEDIKNLKYGQHCLYNPKTNEIFLDLDNVVEHEKKTGQHVEIEDLVLMSREEAIDIVTIS